MRVVATNNYSFGHSVSSPDEEINIIDILEETGLYVTALETSHLRGKVRIL